jgi:hypothetical protein
MEFIFKKLLHLKVLLTVMKLLLFVPCYGFFINSQVINPGWPVIAPLTGRQDKFHLRQTG